MHLLSTAYICSKSAAILHSETKGRDENKLRNSQIHCNTRLGIPIDDDGYRYHPLA